MKLSITRRRRISAHAKNRRVKKGEKSSTFDPQMILCSLPREDECPRRQNACLGRAGPMRRMRLAHCSLACRQLSVVRISGTERISPPPRPPPPPPPFRTPSSAECVSRFNNEKPDAFCACWACRLFLVVSP